MPTPNKSDNPLGYQRLLSELYNYMKSLPYLHVTLAALSLIFSPVGLAKESVHTATAAWAHEQSDIKADSRAVYGTLDNGMRYIVLGN